MSYFFLTVIAVPAPNIHANDPTQKRHHSPAAIGDKLGKAATPGSDQASSASLADTMFRRAAVARTLSERNQNLHTPGKPHEHHADYANCVTEDRQERRFRWSCCYLGCSCRRRT